MAERLETAGISSVILVHHPAYEKAADRCHERLKGWIDVRSVVSKEGGWEPNAEQLNRLTDGNSNVGVGVVAGDGTANDVFVGVLRTPELNKRVAVTSMNLGGGACDVGRALHGRFTKSPTKIFSRNHARPISAHGVDIFIDDKLAATAISHAGAGETGRQAAKFRSRHMGFFRTLAHDAELIASGLASDYHFSILNKDDEPIPLRTLEINKGPAEAKLGIVPVQYEDPKFRVNAVPPRFWAGVRAIAGMAIGHGGGFNTDETQQFVVHSTADGEALPFHVDGDVLPGGIALDSQVTIALTEHSYTLLTTK